MRLRLREDEKCFCICQVKEQQLKKSAHTTCLAFHVFSAYPVTFPLFSPGLTTKVNKSLKSVERGSGEEELEEHKPFHFLASPRCTVRTQGCLLVPHAQTIYPLSGFYEINLLTIKKSYF